ncbi:methyl-accepting chemotaxis protein [Ottowia pentelensis]|uniref:Methyl-accepting chemotaxis protein n=2 Tax=Ottowia pentelensis TaxID=511108 RepID=A0ABV6PV09_9BURK|nr:type IV pili methyl-accepting chemotaxis transducer N-terminal domain-containing protein [Pseudomonadota bacterium]MBS0413091.1 type IV pili methyl-accepting chemotaxis transducer N-terminal domain-containing protein [Pseudomonadota bacterium]HMN56053.1 methyl-accepting chemotaxis protein [Ottowia sp.]
MALIGNLSMMFKKPAPAGDGLDQGDTMVVHELPSTSSEYESIEPESVAPLVAANDAPARVADDAFPIAGLGTRTAAQHQRLLSIVLAAALIALAIVVFWMVSSADRVAQQVGATGQALMQSQRLAKSVSQALLGNPAAFAEVKDSAGALVDNVDGLRDGRPGMAALGGAYGSELGRIMPMVERAQKSAATVLAQEKVMTQVGTGLRFVSRKSADLSEAAETVSALKLQHGAAPAELAASGQLVMMSQRIGKSASELLTVEGVSPEAIFLLGKDLNSFQELGRGLLDGSSELRLAPARDAQTRDALTDMLKVFEEMRAQAAGILGNVQNLAAVRDAQNTIATDSEPLRKDLEGLQARLADESGVGAGSWLLMAGVLAVLALAIAGLVYTWLRESRQRQSLAELQRQSAEQQELDAKRVNDANQAAILRLMNELQTVAEGDLTQEATVTEDITGAIADSVNYTVEELRSLVGSVQSTATRVAQTTSRVESTSSELLATSTEQLHEIRQTGQSVLDMATRINAVSEQAQQSATVARQSLQAAESGLSAVQNAIGGMNSIRDQIQETSKRIKRLGESSQEIGEITELISDITEQTNVLALNAAIQAASAGDAGRGFSVVAEEVQRLAERSADATRQIATLVKTIQTDTQDAVAAMERSTQGVVEGAQLSDRAGTALTEIDSVSRRLAQLIEQISVSASNEAGQANEVAGNIQHIFATTEHTGESTRSTAQQVRDLARMADELRQSVARFKIA